MTKNMIKFSSKRLENESTQLGTNVINPQQFYNANQGRMFHHFERVTGMDLSKNNTPDVYFNSLPKSRYSASLWSDFSKMPGAIYYDRKWYWLTNHLLHCEVLQVIMPMKHFTNKHDAISWYNGRVADDKTKPYTRVVGYVRFK